MAASCRQVWRRSWRAAPLLGRPGAPVRNVTSEPTHGHAQPETAQRQLADMGFSDSRVGELLRMQPGLRPQQVVAAVAELLLLGLEPEPVCEALRRNPQILRLPGQRLKERAGHLRRLGLGEGHLEHMTRCCPELFTMSQQRIDTLVSVLKDKCLFSGQQVAEIVGSCPRVLQEEPMALEYKFQYAYFRMGIKQRDLVKTKYFQYSMTKIKQRHIFLERLGLYQTPDKKGQTQICNPSVNSILRVSEAEFLAKTAHSSSEEFEIFKKLLAREELEEEEGLHASDEEDSDLSDSDDSGDEKD
ncbi:transcription termination factor 4, mitochondrial isoform X2 [Antechinus flavipes]|uniref:transcription termination factor 4, mitochondrial isoform X2 n=1 Tax=Antechinus flavipes TaxID=38775 RepID=UPI00223626A9|nr:transcription termination factor 4, mitochondrial isoform X2 [Antechinus flavipes]